MNLFTQWANSSAYREAQEIRHALDRAHGFRPWNKVVVGKGLLSATPVEQRTAVLAAAGFPFRVKADRDRLIALIDSGRQLCAWTVRGTTDFYFSQEEDAVFMSLL